MVTTSLPLGIMRKIHPLGTMNPIMALIIIRVITTRFPNIMVLIRIEVMALIIIRIITNRFPNLMGLILVEVGSHNNTGTSYPLTICSHLCNIKALEGEGIFREPREGQGAPFVPPNPGGWGVAGCSSATNHPRQWTIKEKKK